MAGNLTQSLAKRLLRFDRAKGILYWRKRSPDMFTGNNYHSGKSQCDMFNKRYAGKIAGTAKSSKGYCVIGIDKQVYLAHRVIWLLEYGNWPNQVDHIDGDKTNNRLGNLRSVSGKENQRNMAISRINRSGTSGVDWHRQAKRWRARINASGVSIHLGLFTSKSDAVLARKKAERRLGYHYNHGRQRLPSSSKSVERR